MSDSTFSLLLGSTPFGSTTLANRVVMAPMTRSRATRGGLEPTASTATYYAQRASAGLIVTEATQVSASAVGYTLTPGLHTEGQVAAWRRVTDAVHARGGRIFVQLWHTGRLSHRVMQPDGSQPVSASPIAAEGEIFTYEGNKTLEAPRALDVREIAAIVGDFASAARRADEAGFDGIELHAANGYLIDQFLRDGSNHRTDEYGGSPGNRSRFLREIVEATTAAIGAHRVGVRISPASPFNSMSDSDPEGLTTFLAQMLDPYGLAYLHVVDPESSEEATPRPYTALARAEYSGTVITNAGFTPESAERILAAGTADLVAFGVPLLANPDYVERLREGVALNTPDPRTFYGGDDRGYIDYPFRDGQVRTTLEPALIRAARS